jgi:hypothetical protein
LLLCIQQVAQAGWSPVLFRVMQELQLITCRVYIIFILLIMWVFILITFFVVRPEVVAHDKLIATKSGY